MTRDIRSLEQTLLENLAWHKARIKFVTRFLLALLSGADRQPFAPRDGLFRTRQSRVELQTAATLPLPL